MCLAQAHKAVMPVRLELATPLSRVKHSTNEPLCSNRYGHVETVSSPNHTFILGKLDQVVNQYFMHLLSLVTGMKELNWWHMIWLSYFHEPLKFFYLIFCSSHFKVNQLWSQSSLFLKGGAEFPKVNANSMLIWLNMDLD